MSETGDLQRKFFSRQYLGSRFIVSIVALLLIVAHGIYSMLGYAESTEQERLIAWKTDSLARLSSECDALIALSDLHFDGTQLFLRELVAQRVHSFRTELRQVTTRLEALFPETSRVDETERLTADIESDLDTLVRLLKPPSSTMRDAVDSLRAANYATVSHQLPRNVQALTAQVSESIALVENSIEATKEMSRLSLMLGLPMSALLICSALIGIRDRILRPIERIVEVEEASQLQSLFYDDVAEFPIDQMPDPIAQMVENLSDSFEQYEAKIAHRTGELVAHTERLESQAQTLRETLVEADESNQAKSRFISAVSHETRTPLNAIIGLSDILLESDLSEEQQKHVELLRKSGKYLLDIINDVLTLSSGPSGVGQIVDCDYRNLIDEVLLSHALSSGESDLETRVEIGKEFPSTVAIPISRVRQILTNLVENAFRYTADGRVTVRAKLEFLGSRGRVTRLVTEIEDTGPGISEEDQTNIFEPFVQLSAPDDEQTEGMGLGLALVDSLCKSMGGSVSVQSNVGEGATFRFVLPVSIEQE